MIWDSCVSPVVCYSRGMTGQTERYAYRWYCDGAHERGTGKPDHTRCRSCSRILTIERGRYEGNRFIPD